MWNGCLLLRTAAMFPDCPRADEYREKGYTFLINAISVPTDATCSIVKDGRKVSDRHLGANFFESYALNHHGYLNVGYMVICLSNMAVSKTGVLPSSTDETVQAAFGQDTADGDKNLSAVFRSKPAPLAAPSEFDGVITGILNQVGADLAAKKDNLNSLLRAAAEQANIEIDQHK